MNDNDKILLKKLKFFNDNRIAVHILKKDGRFNNGIILELQGDLLILDDEKFGATPIYFLEINFAEKRARK